MTVRTRNDLATLTTRCLDGEEHRFTISLEGVIDNPHHDADADAVVAALGGSPHPCGKLHQAYKAAYICYEALTGIKDVPGFRNSSRQGLNDRHTCPNCSRYDARHIASPAHQADKLGADKGATTTLLRWLLRRGAAHDADFIASPYDRQRVSPRYDNALQEAFGTHDATHGGNWNLYRWNLTRTLVTPRYVKIAKRLVGSDPGNILALRNKGVRVEWIEELSHQVTPRAIRHAQEQNALFPSTLATARNVPARKVARYLNAGVTAHFHTYATRNIHPGQILSVYRATEGRTSLADLILGEGLTVAAAMQRVGV